VIRCFFCTDEIAKVTHDPAANERLLDYLRKRLASPNADVKFKVLNIIKHVCRKGNPGFRKAWQRDTLIVKECLQFNCPPDMLRGDEPSRRVREGAKEALEAIFDASRDERKDPNVSQRIQGSFFSIPMACRAEKKLTHFCNTQTLMQDLASPLPQFPRMLLLL